MKNTETITDHSDFTVELKTGSVSYTVKDITIRIIPAPIYRAPLVQPSDSCIIIGDFSHLKLNTFDKLECRFYKNKTIVCSGDFYYNDITQRIELVGALTLENVELTEKDHEEIKERLKQDEYGLYMNAENYKLMRAKMESFFK